MTTSSTWLFFLLASQAATRYISDDEGALVIPEQFSPSSQVRRLETLHSPPVLAIAVVGPLALVGLARRG